MTTALVPMRPSMQDEGRRRRPPPRRRRRRGRGVRIDVGAVIERREKWISSIPNVFTPAEGQKAAASAVDEVYASVRAVKQRIAFGRVEEVDAPNAPGGKLYIVHQHGTLPPPPWPATPELVAALDDMVKFRDGFEVFTRKNVPARWPLQTGKLGPAFVRAGDRLYYELGRFEALAEKAERGGTLDAVLRALPDPRRVLFSSVPTWALVVGGFLAWKNRARLARLFG